MKWCVFSLASPNILTNAIQRSLADIAETLHDDEDVMLAKLEELLSVGDEGHDQFNYIALEEDGKKLA